MIYLLMIPYMAAMYRLRGHSLNIRPMGQVLYSVPYAWFAFLDTGSLSIAIVTLIFTTIMVIKGHGHNMDLGSYKGGDYEWYEAVIKPLHGKIPEYWYDVLGLCISGLTYTIPVGLLTLNPLVAVSGASKSFAYMIGWKFFNNTESGEWFTGAISALFLYLAITI